MLRARRRALFERGEQSLIEFGRPVRRIALIVSQRFGGQPGGNFDSRVQPGKFSPRTGEGHRACGGLRDVAKQRIDHGRRIPQLIERALEFGECRGATPVGALSLTLAKLPPRLPHPLACEVEIVEHPFELSGAHLIFGCSLLLRATRDPLTLRIDRAGKPIRVA